MRLLRRRFFNFNRLIIKVILFVVCCDARNVKVVGLEKHWE